MDLTTSNLTIGYDRPVQAGIELTVRPGEIVGLTGASGSGKTTLLRTLAGLTAPLAGTITVPGTVGLLAQHPRQVTNPRWRLRRIIAEPAAITGAAHPAALVDALADRVGLAANLLDRFPAQVSDGQLQRACLARLVFQEPDWVLCDEPTAMLDPIAARTVTSLLARMAAIGAGVVVASHNHTHLTELTDTVTAIAALTAVRP